MTAGPSAAPDAAPDRSQPENDDANTGSTPTAANAVVVLLPSCGKCQKYVCELLPLVQSGMLFDHNRGHRP